MAVIRNPTLMDIRLPNWIVVPARSEVACENGDILSASVFPMISTLTADGQLSYKLDPEPAADKVAEPAATEPAAEPPAVVAEATPNPLPPPAGKASKG